MIKLIELINEFKKKGVEFVSLENNLDTSTTMGMLLFNICAAFSEMERELIKERIQTGVDAAALKGNIGGRPKTLTNEKTKTIKALAKTKEMSVKKICETMQISRSTYYRCIEN